MKRIRIAVALLLGLIGTALSLTACGTALDSVKSMLKQKYSIDLPSDTELVYCHYESEDSFHGDGIDYFVFKFHETPSGIVKNFKSVNLKEGDNPDELKEELIEYFSSIQVLTDKIPQEYLPDWDSEIIWNDGAFSAIYYPESMEMIVCIITT